MLQRLSDLLQSGDAGRRPRRQLLEIAKIVGTVGLVFGVAAWLLVWITDSSASQRKDPAANTEKNFAYAEKAPEATEVPLGKFSSIRGTAQLAGNNPEREGLRVVEFEVAGITRGNMDEIIHFERGLDQYQQRLKQAMTEIARGATEQELTDPRTVSLRERICDKLNDLFGKNRFDSIVFSNFRVYDL